MEATVLGATVLALLLLLPRKHLESDIEEDDLRRISCTRWATPTDGATRTLPLHACVVLGKFGQEKMSAKKASQ